MPGFHFYDVDFSLANHLAGVKVGVIFDIQITHKSIGITNQQWEDNRKAFTAKWQSILPYHIEPQIQFRELSISCNEEPEVAVIIPAKKHAEILFTCIQSIKEKTRYKNYTIYIADTGSDVESLGKIEECLKGKTAVVLVRNAFNNPAMVLNDMARNHIKPGTGLIIFCHDDIQLINDAISRCVQIYLENRNIAGTIGVRLHLRDGSIQHAGIQLSVDRESQLRISYKGYKSYYNYYPGVKPDVFSNTGAFMAVDKDFFLSSGGFSEQYQQFLEDTEFNIRAVLAGRINYFAGDAVAYHHELEAENNDPEIMKKEYEDYLRLLEHIRQNADNPYLAKHITFIYT
jgi:GT2 family glycosyltransferase